MAEAKQKEPDFSSALARLCSAVLSQDHPERISALALKQVRKAFNARISWIFFFEGDGLELAQSGDAKTGPEFSRSEPTRQFSPDILSRTYPIVCNRMAELYGKNRAIYTFLKKRNLAKFMGVSLLKDGKPVGTLNVGRTHDSPDFTEEDLKSLAMLGSLFLVSRHRLADEESKRSQDFLEAIIDNIPNPIFIKDRKHRFVVLNRACADVTGYPREEMLGKSDYDFFPKDQADFFREKDEEMFRTGKVVDIPEESITDREGTLHYIHTKKAPLKDASRRITHLVGIIEDITLRKQMEQALVDRERIVRERARFLADLRSLVHINLILTRVCEAVRDSGLFERAVMTLHKPGGNIFHLGQVGLPAYLVQRARRAAPICRKLKAKMTGKRFRVSDSFFVPAEVGLDFSKSGRYIPQKKASPDRGDWRLGDELFVPLRDFSGRTTGYLSVDTPTNGCRPDLKTIQALETLVEAAASRVRELEIHQALTQERDFSQSILDTANSMILCLDADARITVFNRECERVTGYRREEVLGKRWPDLFLPPEQRHHQLKSFSKWVRAHPRDRYEGPLVTKSGEIRNVLWSNTAILGPKESDVTAIAIGHDITERKKTEEALRNSEEVARALLNASHDIALLIERDGTIVALSRATARILGKDAHKLVGTCAFDLFEPEVSALRRAMTNKAIRSGQPVRFEDKRGLKCWDSNVYPVFDERGKVARLAVFAYDITDRKRAEEALQEGESRYRSLFEDSPVSLWEEDFSEVKKYIDGLRESGITDFRRYFDDHPEDVARCAARVKVLDVNKASLKLYKAKDKEELKSGLAKLFAEDSYIPFKEELIAVAEGKTSFESEAVTQTSRGQRNYVTLKWTIPPGYESTLSKVVVAITDITERKIAEEALQTQESMYRTLVETALEGIGIVDTRENLVFVNQAFANLLGYKRDELLGKNLREISEKAQLSIFEEQTEKRKKGKSSKYETRLLTKKGKLKDVYVSAAPLWNEEGNFIGTMGVVSDLTEVKKAKEYNILLNASRSLSRTLRFDEVLRLGAVKMTQALNADRCAFILSENASKGSTIKVHVYDSSGETAGPHPAFNLRADSGHLSSYKETLRANSCIQVFDIHTDPVPEMGRRIVRRARMVSALIVPILLRNRVLGVFHVGTAKQPRAFSSDQVRLALTLANHVAVALQNCKLMQDLEREHSKIIEQARLLKDQYREQKMMFELTQTLASARSLNQLLKSATKKIVEILKTERSSISLVNPDGLTATIRAAYFEAAPQDHKLEGFTFDPEVFPQLKEILVGKKTFVFADTSALPKGDVGRKYLTSRGIRSTVAVPLVSRGKTLGFLTASTVKEVHNYTKDEIRLLQTISNAIGVSVENRLLLDDLKRRYAQIEDQTSILSKQTREKDILLKVSRSLSKAMNLDEVGKVASHVVGSALGVERCAVTLSTEDGQLELKGLFFKEKRGTGKLVGTKFSWDDIAVLTNAIKKRKHFVINDLSELPSGSKTREYFLKAGIKSALGVGMFFGERLIGILSITATKEQRAFSQVEIKLVRTIANQIAVAIENARLLDVVEKHRRDLKDLAGELIKVSETEREKIARELHDQLGQMIQAMKMNLDRIRIKLSSRPQKLESVEEVIQDTRELLEQTIEDIRILSSDLRPQLLADFGLEPTLRWYVDNYAKRSNINVVLKVKDKGFRFPQEVELTLYRIVQEALTNVAKHSGASEVTIHLSRRDSTATLSIRDNGIGFDAKRALSSRKGMGLRNIKERTDMLGGSFDIISRSRKGTTLTINVPFSEVKNEEG